MFSSALWLSQQLRKGLTLISGRAEWEAHSPGGAHCEPCAGLRNSVCGADVVNTVPDLRPIAAGWKDGRRYTDTEADIIRQTYAPHHHSFLGPSSTPVPGI